jgi:hypothetical protein
MRFLAIKEKTMPLFLVTSINAKTIGLLLDNTNHNSSSLLVVIRQIILCVAASFAAAVMAQASPLLFSMRGSIDIDGNGKSVLLVRTTNSNGSIAINPQLQIGRLVGNGASSQFQFTSQTDPGVAFRVVGVTDYDGNGRSDLLIQNMTQGEFGDVHVWTNFVPTDSRVLRQVKQVWDVQVVGDLDGDGKGDLVWRYVVPNSPDTGVSYIWFSNGNNTPIVRKRGGAPLNWKLLGAADLNADNAADMVYISPDNQIRVLMATSNRTCANMISDYIPQGFTALALADFTGRNRGDVLIRNNATGQVSLLALNASGIPLPVYTGDPDDRNASCTPSSLVISSQAISLPSTDTSWQFYASGDYDGNGTFDMVWLKPDGTLALWLMGKDGTVQSSIPNAGSTALGYASTNGTTYWSPIGGSNVIITPPPTNNQAPTVSLTAPVNNASVVVNTSVNITATAADADGTVAKVEFFVNGSKIGEDTSAPYSFSWTPTAAGSYSLTARATDNANVGTPSATVNVTVTGAVTPPLSTVGAQTFDIALNLIDRRTDLRPGVATNGVWSLASGDLTAIAIETPSTPASRIAVSKSGVYKLEFRSAAGVLLTTNNLTVQSNNWVPTSTSNAVDYIQNLPRPTFKSGHTLKPLGSASTQTHPAILVALADRWGWALQTGVNEQYCDLDARQAQGAPGYSFGHNNEVIKILQDNPGKYHLMLSTSKLLPGQNVSGSDYIGSYRGLVTPETVWMNTSINPTAATRINSTNPFITPMAPLTWARDQGVEVGKCIKKFTDIYPVTVIADFAEYGPSVVAGSYCQFVMDKRALIAVGYPNLAGSPYPNCGTPIPETPAFADRDVKLARLYARSTVQLMQSHKKGLVSLATWRGGEPFLSVYGNSYLTDRGRWGGWKAYGFYYEDEGATKISNASSPEHYYNRFNSGFGGINSLGTPSDITTNMLNNVGGSIQNGVATFYPWISSGWGNVSSSEEVADRARWMGFLKVMYTAGAVGALSGWFDYTDEFAQQTVRSATVGITLPVWLYQYADVSHTHALFTHLEPFLRNGDLVQGATHQGSTRHPYDQDPSGSPAVPYYALKLKNEWKDQPAGTEGTGTSVGGPQAFVLARKMRGEQRWLITAWANQGADRNVVATLPGVGDVTLQARISGTVYIATLSASGTIVLRLLDVNPMDPTALLFP